MISIHYRNNRQRMVDLLYSQTMQYMLKVYTKQKLRLMCSLPVIAMYCGWLVGRSVGWLFSLYVSWLLFVSLFLFSGLLVGFRIDVFTPQSTAIDVRRRDQPKQTVNALGYGCFSVYFELLT